MQMLIQNQNKICELNLGLHPNTNIKFNFWNILLRKGKLKLTKKPIIKAFLRIFFK